MSDQQTDTISDQVKEIQQLKDQSRRNFTESRRA